MTAPPLPLARTYEVVTYGCQMNVHDSERIAGLLDEAGYAPAGDGATGAAAAGDAAATGATVTSVGALAPVQAASRTAVAVRPRTARAGRRCTVDLLKAGRASTGQDARTARQVARLAQVRRAVPGSAGGPRYGSSASIAL